MRCRGAARRLSCHAVQLRVSTNEPAVRLWRELGFRVVGTLPGVFRHPARGYVDAYVMFRTLTDD
jgi:ribosomal protein S18 acetylase RimI-like enzyme